MNVLITATVTRLFEAHRKGHLFTRVVIEVETKRVDSLGVKSVSCGKSRIWIDCHDHDRRSRCASKQVKVAKVQTRVFPGHLAVKMM